ncbi:leucine-rich repeat domain-containing protein [Flavobacterium gelatinilyticum]|uniref:leucine-rich repeat domain-containing protein n=1 Tax=Flavobacterium gelatinilyticum TaxID=3003260 RepID=UPI00248029BB|nr:leucine-rich repeat domain-containing protein [Flavobacterium gelatinilyticum]
MATSITTILGWFRTGLKPTQAQFEQSWTSFWHKDETIPQSKISNLTTVLNQKAEKSQFDSHLNNPNAHAELFDDLQQQIDDLKNSDPSGFEIKGEYSNNAAAKTGGLIEGDFYRTPISTDAEASFLAVVVKIPDPTMILTFEDISTAGVADINDIGQWNSRFSGSCQFETVTIAGNVATFTRSTAFTPLVLLPNMGISDIDFIKADGMNVLILNDNIITSFNTSSTLPLSLSQLSIQNNRIVTFDPDKALPANLNVLDLTGNLIVDFDPASLPVNLQNLQIINNKIVVFNPSKPLPSNLKILALSANQIVDFNPSIELPYSLRNLALGANQIVSFNPSQSMYPSLEILGLEGNQIVSFDPQVQMESLQYLYLGDNKIVVFDPVVFVLGYNLGEISLNANEIENFNPGTPLPSSVRVLRLGDNKITEFNPTHPLSESLNNLQLQSNMLSRFNPTQPLPANLLEIVLSNNPITTANWNSQTGWIAALPDYGYLQANDTIESIVGTTTESMLLAKNWNILSESE